jgi:hypothetical protein
MDAFDAVGRVATRDHAPDDPLELA